MPEDFLIGKQSLLKVESTRNYTQENKVKLSVDVDILKNKNYNRYDVSKDPASAFLSSPANSVLDIPVDTTYIQIASQIWTVNNLDVEYYNNGDPIPQVTNATQWANLTTGSWCYYNNSNKTGYGKLYNWFAVTDPRGIAPNGYRVPNDADWSTLNSVALANVNGPAGPLKEAGTTRWASPNTGATNELRFFGLPGGNRSNTGTTFSQLGNIGFFWSATEVTAGSTGTANSKSLRYNQITFPTQAFSKRYGFSVRCVKDA